MTYWEHCKFWLGAIGILVFCLVVGRALFLLWPPLAFIAAAPLMALFTWGMGKV